MLLQVRCTSLLLLFSRGRVATSLVAISTNTESRPGRHRLIWTLLLLSHQLEKKAELTKAVQPLRLPNNKSQVKPGDTCLVAGWGRTTPSGTSARTLQEVELRVQDKVTCKSSFGVYSDITAICAGDPKGNQTSFKVRLPLSVKTELGEGGTWGRPG